MTCADTSSYMSLRHLIILKTTKEETQLNKVVFKTEPSEKGVHIPNSMLKLSGLDGLPLEAHTLKGATVIISGEMEAMELIQTVDSLQKLYRKLLEHLIAACGKCSNCNHGESSFDDCPNVEFLGEPRVKVPEWALDEADIPSDAKLSCYIDKENGEIRVVPVELDFDVNDIPPYVKSLLSITGTCVGAFEEMLVDGRIIYG